MVKTVEWLVSKVLAEQLGGLQTNQGRDCVAPALASVLLRVCKVQHWFGVDDAEREQQLLEELRTANPTLPASIRHGGLWTVSDIHAAAALCPALAPLFYFLFEIFGDKTAVNFESWQSPSLVLLKSQYTGLVKLPQRSHQPTHRVVLLRSLILGAKLHTLLPETADTPLAHENLAHNLLIDLARRASQQRHNFFDSQPANQTEAEILQPLCELLVKLLAPMITHCCTTDFPTCPYLQNRALVAAEVLAALLQHGDMDIPAAVADAFLAGGSYTHQHSPCGTAIGTHSNMPAF